MPNINLRLTDEEHDALREWAHGSHRSLQREIIFRLFSERTQADAQPRDVRTRSVPPAPDPKLVSWRDREVKTDFKGGK